MALNQQRYFQRDYYFSIDDSATVVRNFFSLILRKKKTTLNLDPVYVSLKKKKNKQTVTTNPGFAALGENRCREAGLMVCYPEQVQNMGQYCLRVEKANVLPRALIKA